MSRNKFASVFISSVFVFTILFSTNIAFTLTQTQMDSISLPGIIVKTNSILQSISNKQEGTQKQIEEFIKQYNNDGQFSENLIKMVKKYNSLKEYEKSYELLKGIIKSYAGKEWIKDLKLYRDESHIYVLLNQKEGEQSLSEIQDFIKNHLDKPESLNMVNDFVKQYDALKSSDPNFLATSLNQSEKAIVAPTEMDLARTGIISLIDSNDHENALYATKGFVAQFKDQPELLGKNLCTIAERIYRKGNGSHTLGNVEEGDKYYREALQVWGEVRNNVPVSIYTPRAYYASAVVYCQELKEHKEGVKLFETIVDKWPDYQFAWHAQYFIGMYLEQQAASEIEDPNMRVRIVDAYQKVLSKYPDSKSVPDAVQRLGQIYLLENNWAQAAIYYEVYRKQYLSNYEDNVRALRNLANCYEKIGAAELALDVYIELLEMINQENSEDPMIASLVEKIEDLQNKKALN